MNRFRRRVNRWLVSNGLMAHKSFSQCGEDLVIKFVLETRGIECASYMDIGAHHPNYLNNTKLLYRQGGSGVNIEANPALIARFQKHRPRDVNLNLGIVAESSSGRTLDFFVMSAPTMSTFSEEEARRLERETSQRILKMIQIPTMGLHAVVTKYTGGRFPDVLSVDIEGLDAVVVPSISEVALAGRPKVICMETLTYTEGKPAQKKVDLIQSVSALGYMPYADTYINTIFCRSDLL